VVYPVHTIIMHPAPHLDEIVALLVARLYGERLYPGISTAQVLYMGSNELTMTPEQYLAQGCLPIGVGNGRYDEHPKPGSEEKKPGECASTLLAKDLNVQGDLALMAILQETLYEDTLGARAPAEFPTLGTFAKILHYLYKDDLWVVNWVMQGVYAVYCALAQGQLAHVPGALRTETVIDVLRAQNPAPAEQWADLVQQSLDWEDQRFQVAATDFAKARVTDVRPGGNGRSIKIAAVNSDNHKISPYARSEHGGYCAVVIQKKPNGQVQIHTNRYHKLELDEVAKALRQMEEKAGGVKANPATFGDEGFIGVWYYHKGLNALFNGTITAPNVPPTKLSLEQIERIVRDNLKQKPKEAR